MTIEEFCGMVCLIVGSFAVKARALGVMGRSSKAAANVAVSGFHVTGRNGSSTV